MKTHLLVLICCLFAWQSMAQTSNLNLSSANLELVDHFNWAKNRALDLVITGEEDYTQTAYWGSYAHDPWYCIRDITHQSEAGHLLGLGDENFNMMRQFAISTKDPNTSQKDWVVWKIDFYGNTSRFTRELPSPFDAVQRCYENYLWSGDSRWITDYELNYFYSLTLNKTVDTYDRTPYSNEPQFSVQVDPSLLGNGVVGITDGEQNGLASYHEFQNEKLYEAGDAFGSQYQATIAYSEILRAQGYTAEADVMAQTAANLKNHYETNWYSVPHRRYIRGFEPNGNAQTNWGHENSFFMVLKKLIEQGTDKGQNYIDFVHVSTMNNPINIEAQTYYAELFYNNEQNHLGWHWLLKTMRSRNLYPEVAFLCIYNTVGGLLGVRPNAPANTFYTIPRLTKAVPWVEAANIPIGNNIITVRHDGNELTTATNNSSAPINWEAQFYGTHSQLMINGSAQTAQQKQLNGFTISYVTVNLTQSNPVTVSIPASPPGDFVHLSDMTPESSTDNIYYETNTDSLIMMVRDHYFTEGLSIRNATEVVYDVTGNSLFKADVGVDRQVSGSMNFQVWGDGTLLYETGSMTEQDDFKKITVDIVGIDQLKLLAVGSGGTVSAIWGNAGVARTPNADFIVEFVSMTGDDNGDGLVDPGETIDLKVKVTNAGVVESGNINLSCDTWAGNPSYITITGGTGNIGTLAVGASIEKTISVAISSSTPRQNPLEFTFIADDGAVSASITRTFTTPYPIFDFTLNGIGAETAEDGELSAGETASFDLSIKNSGNGASNNITATCEVIIGNQHVTIEPVETSKILSPVMAGNTINYTHQINVNNSVIGGTELKFKFVIDDGIDRHEIVKQYWTTKPDFKFVFNKLHSTNNLLPMVEAGYETEFILDLLNNGNGPSGENTTLSVNASGPNSSLVTLKSSSFNIGSMSARSKATKTINFTVSPSARKGDIIQLNIEVSDGTYSKTKTQKFIVEEICVSDMQFAFDLGSYSEVFRDSKVMSSSQIALGGITYAKGLGLHAERTIHVSTNGLYSRFLAVVGIDDSNGGGSVKFNVYDENDVVLYTGGLLEGNTNGPSETENIDIDITGVQTLKLEVTDGNLNGITSDHADWGNPQLTIVESSDSQAPSVPGNLVVSNVTGNSADLSWDASTDNVGVTGYVIYLDGAANKIATNTGTTLENLSPETQYSVYITAKDVSGNESTAGDTESFTTLTTGFSDDRSQISREVLVYPNPSDGKCKVQLPFVSEGNLYIIDASGKILVQQKIENQKEIDLDFRSLKTGTYYIRINSEQEAFVKQLFIIE